MQRIISVGLLFVLLFVFSGADSLSIIELKPGMNEVSIKVLNKCDLCLKSIHVVVKQDDLPQGMIISPDSKHLDVSRKSESKKSLALHIKVTENAKEGVYEIPFMLMDEAGHSWEFVLGARLEISEPEKYELLQNYPNPFNAATQIKYLLANDGKQQTQLMIFDLLGNPIRTLVNGRQTAGSYRVIWDGRDDAGRPVPSGIYFCRITSGPFVGIKKLMLLK